MDMTTESSLLSTWTPDRTEGSFNLPVLIASGTIGSVTIIIHLWITASIAFSTELHSVSNILLASLSSTELLIGILGIWSVHIMVDIVNEYPILQFEIYTSCVHLVIISYLISSIAIAADRYFKVSRPMQYIRLVSIQKCVVVILVIWFFSAMNGIVMYMSIHNNLNKTETMSFTNFIGDDLFVVPSIYMTNIVIFPAITTVTCLTVCLIHIARRQQRKVKQEMLMLTHLRPTQLQQGQHSENNPIGINHLPRHPQRKTTVYFIVHFSAFVVAWIPNCISFQVIYFWQFDISVVVYLSYMYIFFVLALAQMLVGTVFLTFTQQEHRQVLRRAWQVVKLTFKFTCKWH